MHSPDGQPKFDVIDQLTRLHRQATRAPRFRLTVVLLSLCVPLAVMIARRGTVAARLSTAGALLFIVAAVVAAWAWERRRFSGLSRTVRTLTAKVDPALGERVVRALSLVERPDPGTSVELAHLHVRRTLAAMPFDAVVGRAVEGARRMSFFAVVLGAMTIGLFAFRGWSIVEGADVFLARNNVAPVPLHWVDDVDMHARPPEYLHQLESRVFEAETVLLPRGSLITVRGTPVHAGRSLFVSDGKTEIPLVDDGNGQVVARWPLAESAELRIVARFGDVVIPEDVATPIASLADEVPNVTLEGAPQQLRLADHETEEDIPIRYEAKDDHGLREVHLVLRSAAREERRVLAKLDGETRSDRGGYVLRVRDAFIKKSRAPVEVTVEAKDNDPITGPKWGKSASLLLIPPDIGEPEALRFKLLAKVRDELIDSLAERIDATTSPSKAPDVIPTLRRAVDADAERVESALATSVAGIRVPARLAAILRGQTKKTLAAMEAVERTKSAAAMADLVKASEKWVLVADGLVRGLAQRDARDTAKQLVEPAEDLVLGAAQLGRSDKAKALQRIDASTAVLRAGARSMFALGGLGRQLSQMIDANLPRVVRARDADDSKHAELAARDLVVRLRTPDPSFGAQGSSKRGGGESGGGRGSSDDESSDDSDEVEQAFNEAARDLERLAQEHAGAMGDVEGALREASKADAKNALGDEGARHAEAVRDAVRGLPTIGAGSDSWSSKGAASREHAESMARALEDGNPFDAVSSGKSAAAALDEALRMAERDALFRSNDSAKAVQDARKKLAPEIAWAEEKLRAMRQRAAQRARGELAKQGEAEDALAERARALAERAKDQGSFPEGALDSLSAAEESLKRAAESLRQGNAERGMDAQREAARHLEMAKESIESGGEHNGGDNPQGAEPNGLADIPKADAHKGPEEFRKRVLKGLGQRGSGRLREAVKRYAEGLLR